MSKPPTKTDEEIIQYILDEFQRTWLRSRTVEQERFPSIGFPSIEKIREIAGCSQERAHRFAKEVRFFVAHMAFVSLPAMMYLAGYETPDQLQELMEKPVGEMTVGELKATLCIMDAARFYFDLCQNGFTFNEKPMNRNELRHVLTRLRKLNTTATQDDVDKVFDEVKRIRAEQKIIKNLREYSQTEKKGN